MKKKPQKKSRFAPLLKEVEDFKAGKIKMQVTTVDPVSLASKVHYETYEEMKSRHAAKDQAAREFKILRVNLKFTQKKLATVLRVSKRTLEGWEAGRYPIDPPAELLVRIMLKHPEIKKELLAA